MKVWSRRAMVLVAVGALALGCGTRTGGGSGSNGGDDTATTGGGTTGGETGGTTGGETGGDTGGTTGGETGGDTGGTTGGDTGGTTGGDTGGTTGGDTGGTTGGDPTETTIEALQSGNLSNACDATKIENGQSNLLLKGAIVMTPRYTAFTPKEGSTSPPMDGWWIASGEGMNKGILLVAEAGSAILNVGDMVDIWGEYAEFYCNSQIKASKIEKTGTGDASFSTVVSCEDLADPVKAEPYEGVVVKLENPEVIELGQFEYTLKGGCLLAAGGHFDHTYFATAGDKLTSLTGVVEFSYGKFKIHIRSDADVEGLVEAPVVEKTIADVQSDASSADCTNEAGNLPPTQKKISVSGTVVSPVMDLSTNLNGIYISDSPADAWNGVLILFKKDLGASPAVGDIVAVTGNVSEYYCLTEYFADSIEVTTAGAGAIDPIVVSPEEVQAEKYEGSYVRVEDVEVTNIDNATLPSANCPDGINCWGEIEVTGGLRVTLGDFDIVYTPTVGTKIASITGGIKYSFSTYKLVPFGLDAIVE